ncbi:MULTISPECIES: hypothetical protein [Stenotrophomonas]|uniref:Transmembrane protein n=2 Tax=Stenotrophomonas TaxID=40323 RepID=A0AAW5PP98_9GAMM|nr:MULTISPECIES: hypothetical protein [Stenotrophomonas]MCS4281710.1 hypothetical protein [Stenotrophomonas rhizophila]
MSIHEKFYGQAIREAESGARRDDIWAKAFAEAGGNPARSKALYIQLVARHLSSVADAFDREERRQAVAEAALYSGGAIVRIGKRVAYLMFLWGTWAVLSLALLSLLGNQSQELYRAFVQQQAINLKLPEDPSFARRTFYDAEGAPFLEPTRQDYYNVAVLQSTGLRNAPIPAQLYGDIRVSDFYFNYPEAAPIMLAGITNANQQYSQMLRSKPDVGTVISADTGRWVSLYLIIGLIFVGLTWAVIAMSRRRPT